MAANLFASFECIGGITLLSYGATKRHLGIRMLRILAVFDGGDCWELPCELTCSCAGCGPAAVNRAKLIRIDHAALVVIERRKCRIGTVHEVRLSDIALFVHVVVVKIRDFEQPVDFRQLGEFLPCQLAIEIRRNLVRKGYIKGIIGLPANLFYGTGIPACIVVIDKEDAHARKGIFMIDASAGFMKDGPKNRLRAQDIHKIVDVFTKRLEIPGYSRMVQYG